MEFRNLELTTTSYNAPDGWVQRRGAVGVAILFAYLLQYGFQILVKLEKADPRVTEILQKKFYMLGIAGLLSYTYIQCSVFDAIMAWFSLITYILLHITTLKSGPMSKQRDYILIFHDFLILIWYFGIIIDFYSSPSPP